MKEMFLYSERTVAHHCRNTTITSVQHIHEGTSDRHLHKHEGKNTAQTPSHFSFSFKWLEAAWAVSLTDNKWAASFSSSSPEVTRPKSALPSQNCLISHSHICSL